jgi:hypothetical protein
MPSTPRNAKDPNLEEGQPASLPASLSEPAGLILPSIAKQDTGNKRRNKDDSVPEPPCSVQAGMQIETADDEDPPAPFDPSKFEVDEGDTTNKIVIIDDEVAPAPFDSSEFEVDNEDKTNNSESADGEGPPAPFNPSEFEVDEGVRKGKNTFGQTPSKRDSIVIPPREDIEEGRNHSQTHSISSWTAEILALNDDICHLNTGELLTNPVERNA